MSSPVRLGGSRSLSSWAGVLLAAWAFVGLVPPSALAAALPIAIDAAKIRAITEDVLASQRNPRGRAEKVEALRAYERFVMEDLKGRSTLRAEAIHRLGDLYTQIETSTYDKRVREARTRAGSKGQAPPPPTLDRTKSIAVYERLLTLYPERAENDAALYQLARAYWEGGRTAEAVARLTQLRTRHPRSAYAGEAAFRLGEHAVATHDFLRAVELFQAAQRGSDPALAESTGYQLGWAYLNLQEYRRAADAFVAILDAAARRASPGSAAPGRGPAVARGPEPAFSLAQFPEREAVFVTEVIKALLLSFDYLGGPGEMRAYFTASGRRVFEQTLYRTMGALYQAQDRTADAVAAYETLLAVAPNHPDAPALQSAVVDIYTKAKWQAALIAARERLVDRYGPGGAWAPAGGDTARRAARPLVKEALYQLALYDHAQAQTAKRPDAYEKAIARDDRFLSSFSDDVEAARIAWLRAEALFELGRYDEAAAGYSGAAYDYPLHAQSREAGYAAVVASERVVPPDGPVPPRVAETLFARVERFHTAFPDDQRHADLLMKAAETAARAGLADRAYDAAQRLVTSYPSSRWTAQAKRLIGQTLYDRGQYRDAEQAFRQALAAAPGPQADALKALAAASLYQDASAQRTKGDLASAARLYVQVADEFPATPLAPAALLEAAEAALAAGDAPRAKHLWTRLVGEYKASDQAPPALRRLATAATREGDPAGAIEWYAALSARSDGPARDEIAWTTAQLAEDARIWPQAERALSVLAGRADLPPSRSIEAGFRAARAVARQGRAADAHRRAEAVLDRWRVWRATRGADAELSPADLLAADALLDLADRRADTYAAIRLVTPVEHTLADKRTALNLALDAYAEAAQLKVAGVTTAATHKIGTLFDDFLQAVLDSERPGELTAEQLEQYNILIEEQAAPLEERAVTAYETNVRRTQELGVYDPWVEKSFERLAVLRPARYRRQERTELVQRTLETTR